MFEFAKAAPCEHLRALRELISPASVLFSAAQVLFDTVLHHLATLRVPGPDLLSAAHVAADVAALSLFIEIV